MYKSLEFKYHDQKENKLRKRVFPKTEKESVFVSLLFFILFG